MKRRDFLRATGGSGGAVALGSGVAAGQEGTGTTTGTEGGGGGGGGGPTEEVVVGPGGDLTFEPADLTVATGTTVRWVWDSNNHNVYPESIPEGAEWDGEGEPGTTFNAGHEYSHTFTTTGTYEYVCTPHESAGMVGSIEVVEELPAGGAGGGEKELHEIGAPIHPHWVGAATILMMFVSIVFTFYVLKYGESPNTGNTGGGE
ncbi:halocyanin [Halolamina sp. CBA1230]|uniref:plastocyanin/azurin family copper-binding protein n=1 Tax=Halolamina sp. CBA1230 TaxID=1853690 RepID=UPI0009A138A5|nr:plastocyanin/azurin family copper-binding protein [Halolamina sp. CBA1230]QKY18836.1 halocyanin [Halolamina sp. CBA1230]